GLVLLKPVTVDATTAGTFSTGSTPTRGQVPAGTAVDSYVLHVDPVGSPARSATRHYDVTVTFDGRILGIQLLRRTLAAADPTVGAPGTAYASGSYVRGLEVRDSVTSDNLHTVSLKAGVHRMDEVRVLTTAVTPPPVE